MEALFTATADVHDLAQHIGPQKMVRTSSGTSFHLKLRFTQGNNEVKP
jgi:hypothetical protein